MKRYIVGTLGMAAVLVSAQALSYSRTCHGKVTITQESDRSQVAEVVRISSTESASTISGAKNRARDNIKSCLQDQWKYRFTLVGSDSTSDLPGSCRGLTGFTAGDPDEPNEVDIKTRIESHACERWHDDITAAGDQGLRFEVRREAFRYEECTKYNETSGYTVYTSMCK